MNQFVVPQFIEVEDKIIGPVTTRQFVILLADILMMFIIYKLADLTLMIILDVPLLIAGIVLAFVKVNGMPFHFFLLNVTQTFKRSPRRVWNKNLSDAELIALSKVEAPPPPVARVYKEPLQSTRLNQLALIVNTGGVYNPDEE